MSLSYQFSPTAKADLDSIIDYTVEQFGITQARKYVSSLGKCAEKLATGKLVRTMPDVHTDIQFIKCEHHYIFGFPQKDEPFMIIAILHEKMDRVRHLERRI